MAEPTSFISVAEFSARLGRPTFLALFKQGTDTAAIASVLEDSYAEVQAALGRIYETLPEPRPAASPFLLKRAQVDYAKSFTYERNLEYPRAPELMDYYYKRAEERMEKIAAGMKQLSENKPEPQPRNVGGLVLVTGPRMLTPGPNGQNNGGDF